MTWILIAYLVGSGAGSGGGPVSAGGFFDKDACEAAASAVKQRFQGYQGHVCVRVRS
jgi:hypothetical protein